MFLVNSRLSLFTAPLSGSQNDHPKEDPFFRSYGAKLPSSLTRFLSRALVYSTLPPVSVYGTVTQYSTFRSFSWQHGINQSASTVVSTSYRFSGLHQRICLSVLPTSFDHHIQRVADLASCVTPSLHVKGTGILNLFPIAYAFQPRLRGRGRKA